VRYSHWPTVAIEAVFAQHATQEEVGVHRSVHHDCHSQAQNARYSKPAMTY
jgi:hypothetical protein